MQRLLTSTSLSIDKMAMSKFETVFVLSCLGCLITLKKLICIWDSYLVWRIQWTLIQDYKFKSSLGNICLQLIEFANTKTDLLSLNLEFKNSF